MLVKEIWERCISQDKIVRFENFATIRDAKRIKDLENAALVSNVLGLTGGLLGVAAGACVGAPKVIELSAKTLGHLHKAIKWCGWGSVVTTSVTAGVATKTFFDDKNAIREIKEINAKEMPART